MIMPRDAGDRYRCPSCGATLVYETPCPCPPDMPHSEVCCGQQMEKVEAGAG
jgi:transposase-like protein